MLLLLLSCAAAPPTSWQAIDLLATADPFVGTGGDAFGYGGLTPAAQAPNGLVKLGPDTSLESSRIGFQHTAGYDYDDPYVTAFSHYRLPGIGVGDGGGLGVMMAGAPQDDNWKSYKAPYSHEQESAGPGFYNLTMADRGQVELVASPRAAVHRYTWTTDEHWLMVNLAHIGSPDVSVTQGELIATESGLEGWLLLSGGLTKRGPLGGVPLYFVMQWSEAPSELQLSLDGALGSSPIDGPGLANLRFESDTVELRVGLSAVDVAGARQNLEQEVAGRSLEQVLEQTTALWQETVADIQVAGGTPTQQAIFASALVHARAMPTLMSDSDGRFRGVDGKVYQDAGFMYHSDFSGWDTYRTLHPWVILTWPELAGELASSVAHMGEQLDYIPRWPAGAGESGSMVGSPLEVVLAETVLKGQGGFYGEDTAFATALRHATDTTIVDTRRHNLADYIDYGYLPVESTDGSVSKTQEMAIADHALGLWAASRGDAAADMLLERGKSYQMVHNPETNLATGRRADGSWLETADEGWPEEFIEGNTWQYTWLAPHDPEGLAQAFGGEAAAVASLEQLFVLSAAAEESDFPDPYYWHGNEPDLHASLLFALWGRPDLTQEWVHWIQENRYAHDPAGLDGNDDGGTMSAWYLFTAVGLYPLNGTDRYVLTTPIFDHVRIGELQIAAVGQGIYLSGVILDGQALDSPQLTHAQLMDASDLLFLRSPVPTEWGW